MTAGCAGCGKLRQNGKTRKRPRTIREAIRPAGPAALPRGAGALCAALAGSRSFGNACGGIRMPGVIREAAQRLNVD